MTIAPIKYTAPDYLADIHGKAMRLYEDSPQSLPVLGKGSYGIVYKKALPTNEEKTQFANVAVKVSDFSKVSYIENRVNEEINILQRLKGFSSVLQIYSSYSSGTIITITTNFLPGMTLEQYCVKNTVYHSVPFIVMISKQVLSVLHDLRKLGIVHGDMSDKNIIFDGRQITLIDFGLALDLTRFSSQDHLISVLDQRAPEILLDVDFNDNSPDIFNFGVTIYKIFTKQRLFTPGITEGLPTYNNALLALKSLIGHPPLSLIGRARLAPHYFLPNSNVFTNNIFSTLSVNKRHFMLIHDISHQFLQEPLGHSLFLTELIKSMIDWDPLTRPSPETLLARITTFESPKSS